MAVLTSYLLVTIVVGALTVVLGKIVSWIVTSKRRFDMLKKFPHDPPDPIFGHLLQFPGTNEKGLAYQREMTKRFPKALLSWALNLSMIIVHHPETVKVILKSSEPKGDRAYNLIRPWVGDGLLTSSGAKWARNRRLLTPAFHFEILKNYVEVKNRCVDPLMVKFQEAAETKTSFLVYSNITMFTLDVILRCAMSYETKCQEVGEKHPYVQAVNVISELMVDRFFKPWLFTNYPYFWLPSGRRFLKNCKFVHDVAEDIINKRRKDLAARHTEVEKTGGRLKCMDFLDILLTARDENGQGLNELEIRDEVDTFLFEGHDTTASAISWALYSIAEHPDVQEKLHNEVAGRLSGRESTDILWEDLAELPYLTMVIKECLRLHTPVPFIQRKLTADTVVDGKVIPEGSIISVVLYNAHHNASVWEDSMKFDPERFSPENVQKRDFFAFVPFSAGPRNCIGQTFAMDEMKIALARIVHKYSLRLDPTHVVEKNESVVMRTQNDIKIFVTERNQ